MKRKTKFAVNPALCAVALCVWFLMISSAIVVLPMGRIVSALIFFLIGIVFLAVAARNGIVVDIQPEGVYRRFLGHQISFLSWDKVQEVGVCGIQPFHPKNENKVGTLYIYISEEKLDDKKRFDMVLQWPPRGKVYMVNDQDRLNIVQLRWSRKIHCFNTGEFHIG